MWRLLRLILSALVAVVSLAAPASASCAGLASVEADLARSDLVFVGTVVQVTNRDRWATFAVEDVWKGEPGGQAVEVRAGPQDPGGGRQASSSNDRTYQAGMRYLVFAFGVVPGAPASFFGPDARWTDSTCSSTQPFTPELARLRPLGAPPRTLSPAPGAAMDFPRAQPSPGDRPGSNGVVVLVVLVGAAALLTTLVVRRRNRPKRA